MPVLDRHCDSCQQIPLCDSVVYIIHYTWTSNRNGVVVVVPVAVGFFNWLLYNRTVNRGAHWQQASKLTTLPRHGDR